MPERLVENAEDFNFQSEYGAFSSASSTSRFSSLSMALSSIKPVTFWGTRHTFTLLATIGLALIYAMRIILSIGIVAMVNKPVLDRNISKIGQECPFGDPVKNPEVSSNDHPFNWDPQEQGLILGAFFYGYIFTQIPGGMLAERYGGKWVYGCGALLTGIFTLFTPLAAKNGKIPLFILRFFEGLFEVFKNVTNDEIRK